MAYVRFYSPSLNDTVDEFLFAKYLETDSKGEIIFFMPARVSEQA